MSLPGIFKIRSSYKPTAEIENFVGDPGELFYDFENRQIRISDGTSPGGISVGGAGGSDYILPTASTTVKGGIKVDGTTITINNQIISGFSGDYDDLTNKPELFDGNYNNLTNKPTLFSGSYTDLSNKPDLTVYQLSANAFSGSYTDLSNKPTIPNRLSIGLINSENTLGELFSDVSILRFDSDSGFDVINLGNGSIKVAMNSTFKTWKVDGQNDLIATGLDTIEFEAGTGITITTDPNASPNKKITFTGFSGSYTDLADKPSIPQALSDLSNDLGFITSNDIPKDIKGSVFGDDSTLLVDAVNSVIPYSVISGAPNLSTVATTGSYTDLANKPIKTVTLYQDGTLQVTTGTVRWYNPTNIEIDKVIVRLASAADRTVTVVIKKSNTTFRTIEVSANSTKVIVENLNLEMIEDDFLTVDVTTIGSTNKGSGLSVEFFYTLV
jgi:hypothetical protein